MAQTDTRQGFRLPWTGERGDPEPPSDDAPADGGATEGPSNDATAAQETETSEMIDVTAPTDIAQDLAPETRRPNKFMADLSRAMQTAAETARNETMGRFEAEAKSAADEIHAVAAVEGAALRRRADDDVAAVRDWSKGEIARIREETERRIVIRKAALDGEMDAHAAIVEARVERVAATVSTYQSDMAEFFERLLGEEDPTRIATLAETMPDPPSLAEIAASITEPPPVVHVVTPPSPPEVEVEPNVDEPAAEPDATTPPATLAEKEFDFAAAEAEAATFTGDLDEGELREPAHPEGSHDGPEPAKAPEAPVAASREPVARATTRVVVLGLVSVASIATFKRELGRTTGVAAIGVASGPDGEFVFTVTHDNGLDLAGAITGMTGFDAKVNTKTAEGLEVTAHDPDAAD